jgi:hypothetical protein
MICRDFNLIYQEQDNNNSNLGRRMMGRFRRCLNDLALKEIYLNGHRYTWTNGQSPPTLVHLLRVIATSDWEEIVGECNLRCLASVVSDHSPLLLDCSPTPTHRRFHFEDYWLQLDGFQEAVASAWHSVHDADPFRRLMMCMQATARYLTSWSARSVSHIKHKMALCRELILKFDKAREDRVLSSPEIWLYKSLKFSFLGYASLERTIARQRARIASLKDGDANTTFFHQQCSYRRQKNRIFSLTVDDQVLTEPSDMISATFDHFESLIGTSVDRDCTLNLTQLITPSDKLLKLDAPFTEKEIWAAIKRLPARKAPGPDRYMAEFLHACWGIVKQEFMAVFRQLHDLRGRSFCKLNQALLALLSKKPDTHKLGDYRPISLIHLAAKVIAKAQSLRLAPKLDSLVSKSQNAFISGRNLHDNFVLVRQSMRMLHQLQAPRVLLKLDLARAVSLVLAHASWICLPFY